MIFCVLGVNSIESTSLEKLEPKRIRINHVDSQVLINEREVEANCGLAKA